MGYKNPNSMMCIDKDKFVAALAKRGLNMATASLKVGFSYSYFGNCVARCAMPMATVLLVEHILDIPREEFQVVKEKPVIYPNKTPERSGFDYDKLYQTIYAAMYHAYKQVFVDRKNGLF